MKKELDSLSRSQLPGVPFCCHRYNDMTWSTMFKANVRPDLELHKQQYVTMVKGTRLSPQTFLKSLGVLKFQSLMRSKNQGKRNYRNRHLSLEITKPRKELHLIAYYLDCNRVFLYIVHNYGLCFFTMSIRVWGRIEQNKISELVISSFWECCHLWFSPNFIYNNVVYKHRWILFYQTLTFLIQ